MGYTKSEGIILFKNSHCSECKNESRESCSEYTTVYRGKQKGTLWVEYRGIV